MNKLARTTVAFLAGLVVIAAIGSVAVAGQPESRDVNGTIWVANRGANTIRGFDAATGSVVGSVAMAAGSQPGDLAYAKGKLYVSEEFGSPPAIAIVDAGTGELLNRIAMPVGSRPHHVHASVGGNLVSVGLYGTDMVAVVDTKTDTLLGPGTPIRQPRTGGLTRASSRRTDRPCMWLATRPAS